MLKIILLILLYISQILGAEADGFRNVKWGDNPTKDMTITSQDSTTNIKKYFMSNDKMSVGEATITSISYWYFDNKFMGVFLQYNGMSNFTSLKATLESKYGSPHKPNRYIDYYMWIGGNTRVAIQYNKIKDDGIIMIMNDSLSKESEQYKKDLASKAVNDL